MNETAAPQLPPQFNVDKLYVKDLSLEVPHAPAIFLERDPPQIDLQLSNQTTPVSEGVFEVTVTATVTAKLKDKAYFLIEVKQAGIFQLRNIPESEMETVLEVVCPNILYPYLREVVSDTSVRAGFMPVLLNPIDFSALYAQRKQQGRVDQVTH